MPVGNKARVAIVNSRFVGRMQGVFLSARKTSCFRDRLPVEESDEDELDEDLDSEDRQLVRINVGGSLFITRLRTLKKVPASRLGRLRKSGPHYLADQDMYYFDRDPEIFRVILNYHRLGELHLPLHVCGPSIEKELLYWGVPEHLIEKCCWVSYVQLKSQKYSLLDFERFFADRVPVRKENKLCPRCNRCLDAMWRFLEKPSSSRGAMVYGVIVAIFVFLSLFAFVAETHPSFQIQLNESHNSTSGTTIDHIQKVPWPGLEIIDYVCVIFFTFDILLRLCVTPEKAHFLLSPITVIEIVAIIPYYIDLVSHLVHAHYGHKQSKYVDIIHVFRIFGVLRVFKILRYYSGLQVLIYTLRTSLKDLLLMLTFIGVATLFFSSLIYFSDDRSKFSSIPTSFWWSIVTMTTVGYGDFYPTRPWGYLVGSACALIGVLVVAFTVPILVNSFMLFYSHSQSILSTKRNDRSFGDPNGKGNVPTTLNELNLKHLVPMYDMASVRSNGNITNNTTPKNETEENVDSIPCVKIQMEDIIQEDDKDASKGKTLNVSDERPVTSVPDSHFLSV